MKTQARELWEQDRALWLASQPFLAQLAFQLNLVPVLDSRLPTAATDGASVYVNARFLLRLSAEERQFLLAHEVWHCALGHLMRRRGREEFAWNVAADHEVNALIRDQGMTVPTDCVLLDLPQGQPAETIYENLLGELPDRGRLADLHGLAGLGGPGLEIDPDYAPGALVVDWTSRLVGAARDTERRGGQVPLGARLYVDALTTPRLDWRVVLQQFIGGLRPAGYAWHRPSRRHLGRGLFLPGPDRPLLSLAVALDTSGSCIEVLPRFLAEVRSALATAGVGSLRVLCFDADIQSDVTLQAGDLVSAGTIGAAGGGGTDFGPVLARLGQASEPLDGVVVLTDGFGCEPPLEPRFPVLWVLTADGAPPAPWAVTVRLPGAN